MDNTITKKISAGRVLIKPRGDFDSEAVYEMLDLVNYKGIAWLAKRTSKGVEPSAERTEYWHNLLDLDEVVRDAVAGTLAEEVSDILDERFRDLISEARYVTDLFVNFPSATFVQWDAHTENTPYKAGLTRCYKGFALVYGDLAENHTIIAWTADGESYTTRTSFGNPMGYWSSHISSKGGTMSGPLNLGNGYGSVDATNEGASLQAIDTGSHKYRDLVIENPTYGDTAIENAVKLVNGTVGADSEEFPLFGAHNLALMQSFGFGRVETGSYVGAGTSGLNATSILLPEGTKFAYVMGAGGGNASCCFLLRNSPTAVVLHSVNMGSTTSHNVAINTVRVEWDGTFTKLYADSENASHIQMNEKGITYRYVAFS